MYINVYDVALKTTTTIYDTEIEKDYGWKSIPAYFDKNDKIIFNGGGTLKMMDMDGKNITTIAEPVPPYSLGTFWLSPDREKIIVNEYREEGDIYETGNYERLVMMNADGTGRQIIREEYLGEWSWLAWKLNSKEVYYYHHLFQVVEGEHQGTIP
jgi:hypothetical protein